MGVFSPRRRPACTLKRLPPKPRDDKIPPRTLASFLESPNRFLQALKEASQENETVLWDVVIGTYRASRHSAIPFVAGSAPSPKAPSERRLMTFLLLLDQCNDDPRRPVLLTLPMIGLPCHRLPSSLKARSHPLSCSGHQELDLLHTGRRASLLSRPRLLHAGSNKPALAWPDA